MKHDSLTSPSYSPISQRKMSKFSFLLGLIIATTLGVLANGSQSEARIYELKQGDFSLKVTDFGARVISVVLPDKNGMIHLHFLILVQCFIGEAQLILHFLFTTCSGKPVDVVLGYESIKDYFVS